MTNNKFDIYIITSVSDFEILNTTIPYIKKNIPANRLYIVAKEPPSQNNLLDCNFLNENDILENLSFNSVANSIEQLGGDKKNAGWYLQQFIKLGISKISKNPYYLVWDADTIPLKHLDFFDSEGRPYFNLKREYNKTYFDTIERLISLKKNINASFISEHMIFNVNYVNELIQIINSNQTLKGNSFWEKILFASFYDTNNNQRTFSEFETYGIFITKYHKKSYSFRKLKTLRRGTDFFGENVSNDILSWCSKKLDTISFEKYIASNHKNDVIDETYMKKHSVLEYLNYEFKKDKNELRKALLLHKKDAYETALKQSLVYESDFIFIRKPQYFPALNFIKKYKILRFLFLSIKILTGTGQHL